MRNFKNLECAFCKAKFIDETDVVFCPDCGAPYHKECYKSLGKCLYKDKHGTDETYKAPKEENDVKQLKLCPNCATLNDKEALFCSKCGFTFTGDNEEIKPFNGEKLSIPLFLDPMGGVNPNEEINGVNAGDIAKFVRSNTPYYLPIFKQIDSQKKSRFNFSAFLFSGGWFLYRKQYKIGAVITFIIFSLMIASSFIEYTYGVSILKGLMQASDIASTVGLSSEKYTILMSNFKSLNITDQILLLFPTISNFIIFVVMIFSGFLGNKLYFKHCISKINEIKSKNPNDLEFSEKIRQFGGSYLLYDY